MYGLKSSSGGMYMDLNVLITYPLGVEENEVVTNEFPKNCHVIYPESFDNETLASLATNADVVVGHLTPEMATAARHLKVLQTVGHGIDFIAQGGIREILNEKEVLVA